MTNSSLIKKSLKLALLFFGILLLLIVVTRIGLGLVGTQTEVINLLNAVADSRFVVVIRLAVYVLVFLNWSRLLKRFDSTLSDAFIHATRRPLVVLIALYEIVIVQEWQSIFFGDAE